MGTMLVTGGARGIGAGIAKAARLAGWSVAITYERSQDAADTLVAEGVVDWALRSDAGSEDAVVSAFAEAVAQFGRVDAVVNNAGISGPYGTIETVNTAELDRLWAVNVNGPFFFCREAVRHMSTAHGGAGGSIVNITSKAAVLGGPGEWIHYAASKAAVEALTIGLAKEVATQGIRVNAVRPGLIETDFAAEVTPGRAERIRPTIPMQRCGTVAEVGAAVTWLCSAAASYTTGTFLDVTGGR